MKTETKKVSHTPGPWRIRQHSDKMEIVFELNHASDIPSQDFYVAIIKNGGLLPTPEDAQLIASAPELLEALKGAQSALRKAMPCLLAEDECSYCGEWLDEINATIAKAEGR